MLMKLLSQGQWKAEKIYETQDGITVNSYVCVFWQNSNQEVLYATEIGRC